MSCSILYGFSIVVPDIPTSIWNVWVRAFFISKTLTLYEQYNFVNHGHASHSKNIISWSIYKNISAYVHNIEMVNFFYLNNCGERFKTICFSPKCIKQKPSKFRMLLYFWNSLYFQAFQINVNKPFEVNLMEKMF